MKKPFIIVYTAIISLTLFFAVGLFAFNIVRDYKKGVVAAENRFERLSLSIKQIPENVKLNTIDFDNNIIKAINGIENYATLSITINEQNYINYPTANDIERGSSKLVLCKYKKFDLHGNQIAINADLYILTPAMINKNVKVSFAIILFVTVLTLFMIILDTIISPTFSSTKTKKVEEKNDDEGEKSLENENDENITEEENDFDDDFFDDINIEASSADALNLNFEDNDVIEDEHNIEDKQDEYDYEIANEEFYNALEKEAANSNNENNFVIPQFEQNGTDYSISSNKSDEEKIAKEIENTETSEYKNKIENNETFTLPTNEVKPLNLDEQLSKEPEGLFSPITGFGWESYLQTRLDNELNRATACETDLSLFIIKLENVDKESEIAKEVYNYLSTQFQFKDLIFEYKDDCIVSLKIGSDIDEAFNFANKILVDIDTILNGNGKCYIGITSRSIRMVSGERLITEAEQALSHAKEDEDSPIIAFRVDADKYREFLEKQD